MKTLRTLSCSLVAGAAIFFAAPAHAQTGTTHAPTPTQGSGTAHDAANDVENGMKTATAQTGTATGEHAAGNAGEHEVVGAMPSKAQGIATAVTAIVVFALTAAFLMAKVWPTIAKALDERAAKIQGEIEAAEMARQQAKDALEQYQQSLAQARTEAQREIDKARAQAQVIGAELKAKAEQEMGAMREKAMRDIEQAKRTAVSEVYEHGTQLATTMASKILERAVTPQDSAKLFEDSLRQLQSIRN